MTPDRARFTHHFIPVGSINKSKACLGRKHRGSRVSWLSGRDAFSERLTFTASYLQNNGWRVDEFSATHPFSFLTSYTYLTGIPFLYWEQRYNVFIHLFSSECYQVKNVVWQNVISPSFIIKASFKTKNFSICKCF